MAHSIPPCSCCPDSITSDFLDRNRNRNATMGYDNTHQILVSVQDNGSISTSMSSTSKTVVMASVSSSFSSSSNSHSGCPFALLWNHIMGMSAVFALSLFMLRCIFFDSLTVRLTDGLPDASLAVSGRNPFVPNAPVVPSGAIGASRKPRAVSGMVAATSANDCSLLLSRNDCG